MSWTRTQIRKDRGKRLKQFGWFAAPILGAALLWGCGTPDQRYKILSFFFDGVPDPNAPLFDDAGRARPGKLTRGVNYFVHPPFDEERCEACHQNMTEMSLAMLTPDASVCLKCHEQIPKQYKMMHGPVVAAACLWCHNPHDAYQKYLLRKPDSELCTTCHERQGVLGPDPPAHLDEQRGCLECHSGHGGAARYFLVEADQTGTDDAEAPDMPQPQPTDEQPVPKTVPDTEQPQTPKAEDV